jgi:hypothetical protein
MASVVYNEFKRAEAAGAIDLLTDVIDVKLLMTNTTCDTENDGIAKLSQFTTIDTCDSAGYVDKILTGKSVTKEDANDRAIFDATDPVWTALPTCTRQVQGVLVYKYVDGAGNDIPICYADFNTLKTPDGSDFTAVLNAAGVLYLG